MLKIYNEDTDHDGVPAMLGYEYLRLSEQYRRYTMPVAVWDSFKAAEEVEPSEALFYEITEDMKEYEQLEMIFAN